MEFDLFSCTFENLSSLKFNELQKLSSRFHVTKRWAKKREIIDKILLLRDQKLEKYQPPADAVKSDLIQEDIEWVDGGKAFVTEGMDTNQVFESDDNDRRLTYCIGKSDPDIIERRLTYKIEKPENLICSETDNISFDRRLTYNADEVKCHKMDLKGIISQNHETIKDKVAMDNNSPIVELETERKMINYQAPRKGCKDSASSNVKMTVSNIGMSSHDNARSKMNDVKWDATKLIENPFNIKKSVSRLSETQSDKILKEVSLEAVKDNVTLKYSIMEKNITKIPAKSSANCNRNIKNEMVRQNVTRSVLPRRKSKTEDNVLVKNFKPSKHLMFYSPKESEMKKIRSFPKSSNALDLELTCKSKIPKAKPPVSTQKPIVATKMPDFSKIHQRRFEQMDSLIDYKRKKEERAKKLFGLPQPGIPIKVNANDVTKVYQFKSSSYEEENKLSASNVSLKKEVTKTTKGNKEKSNRKDALSRTGSKSDIMMSLKEQNRKHLHGVRTNKRFELQMKYRKL